MSHLGTCLSCCKHQVMSLCGLLFKLVRDIICNTCVYEIDKQGELCEHHQGWSLAPFAGFQSVD